MPDPFHTQFAEAVRTGEMDALAPWLADETARRRFSVYRNNVVRGAIEALRAAYPAVNRLVGENFFSPMAKSFWETAPPAEQTMTLYGEGFAEHIAGYDPARSLPYLADIARLDRGWLLAHHAAEAAALGPQDISKIEPEDLPALRPGVVPCVQLIALESDVYAIWAANRFAQDPGQMALGPGPAFALIWRQNATVRHQAIDAQTHSFLLSLAANQSLAEAADRAAAADADLAGRVFGFGLSAGLFAAANPGN